MPSSSDEPDDKEEDAASCVRKGNFVVYCEYPLYNCDVRDTHYHHPPQASDRGDRGGKSLSLQ